MKARKTFLIAAAAAMAAQAQLDIPSQEALETASNQLVQNLSATWNAPPGGLTSSKTSQGALLGNGDVGVVIGGPANRLAMYLGKNEFWSSSLHYKSTNITTPAWGGGLVPMLRLDLQIDALNGASYNLEQALATAEVRGRFRAGSTEVTTRSYMAATENSYVTEITATANATVRASFNVLYASLWRQESRDGDVAAIHLSGDKTVAEPGTEAKAAMRVVGVPGTVDGSNVLSFTVGPGGKAYLAVSLLSSHDDPAYQTAAVQKVKGATAASLDQLGAAHRAWWRGYYGKSFVDIPEAAILKYWYASLYLMGSASRKGEAPPGLFGNWITMHPMGWRSDYTLNYNHQATFIGPPSSNHLEVSDNFPDPLIAWLPKAREYALKNLGKSGALYISHIGPNGMASVDTNRWNNMYCGPMSATVILQHYYSSYDMEYAGKVYPMLKAVGEFLENYMVLEGGKYLIYKDEMNEELVTSVVNNVKTLSSVRVLFKGLIDMSTDLGVDAAKRPIWKEKLNHLIYPRTASGAIRCAERGMGDNCVTVWAVPHDYFGMESPKDSLDMAYNTIRGMDWWRSNNWTMYFYWAMARMGHSPAEILTQLNGLIQARSYANLHIYSGGGGLENLNVVPTAVNEMLLSSHQGVIRPFSNWPRDRPARFGNLRAYGAFLVSSELKGGQVAYVRILSEKGRPATVRNPWPGKGVAVYRNHVKAETLSGEKLTFATTPGEIIALVSDGTVVSVRERAEMPRGRVTFKGGSLRVQGPGRGNLEVSLRTVDGREAGFWRVATDGVAVLPVALPGPGLYLVNAAWKDGTTAGAWTDKLMVE